MNYEMEKIYEISAELDSYNALFSAYINQHEDIPEMLHLSLISDKIQEKINELKNITKNI